MKNTAKHAALVGLSVGFLFSSHAVAQDYFREIGMPDYYAPVAPIGTEDEEKYNMALGPVRLSVAAGVSLEYNDNIELSDSNRKEDFILHPSLNIEAALPISEMNTLRFSLGVGYSKYFSHSEYDTDGILLSPKSELAFTMLIGEVKVTLRDRFSYQEDNYTQPTVSNVGVFRRFENAASIQADWDVNAYLTMTGGYEHYNLWTRDEEFKSYEHSVDTVFFKPGYKITPTVTVGINTSFSWINYNDSLQSNGTSWLIGPFVDWAVTDSTRVYAEAGYQMMSFDGNSVTGDSDSNNNFYVRTEINHQISDYLSHRLSAAKTAEPGYGSNYYDIYHVEYSMRWKATPSLIVDPSAFYEHYETSGDEGENADRVGLAIGLRYIITPSVTLGADYRFLLKDSDLDNADYRQNLAMLSLYYNF
jgi:hypothetical protein